MRAVAVNLQTNCALGAVILTSTWDSSRRLRRYSLNGTALTGLGLAMLYVTVAHLSMNIFLAEMLVVPLFMAAISYVVHRRRTFADIDVLRYCSGRFVAIRLCGMGISKLSFLLLVAVMGIHYLLASLLIIGVLAWPTYRFNRDWAFRPKPIHTPETIRGQLGATPPFIR